MVMADVAHEVQVDSAQARVSASDQSEPCWGQTQHGIEWGTIRRGSSEIQVQIYSLK